MKKVIKYKIYYLISNKFVIISTVVLFLLLNFEALLNSGVLFSGGSDFNRLTKYMLLLNNYIFVSCVYGLMFSIYIGSSIIGPDMQTGNILVLLTSYPSRIKYYLGTILAVFIFITAIQLLMLLNIYALLFTYDVSFIFSEVLECFVQSLFNSAVILSVTGLASIYMKGHSSAVVGLLCYAFFNIYTFNTIPFINTSFIFDVSVYRNILCNFLPIVHILPPSYTHIDAISTYGIRTIIPNIYIYQLFYILIIVVISSLCFKRKQL